MCRREEYILKFTLRGEAELDCNITLMYQLVFNLKKKAWIDTQDNTQLSITLKMMHFVSHLHVPDGATHFHRGAQALGVCTRPLGILWHYSVGLNRDMNRSAKNKNLPRAVGCRKLCLELCFFCAIWLNREILTTSLVSSLVVSSLVV